MTWPSGCMSSEEFATPVVPRDASPSRIETFDHDLNPASPPASIVSRGSSPLLLPTLLLIVAVGLLWWFDPAGTNLPLCSFHALTGLDCPGCGVTRASHELLHGRLAAAWHYNALWVTLMPLLAYAAISEARLAMTGRPLPGNLARRSGFWLALAVLGAGFFLVRNLPW